MARRFIKLRGDQIVWLVVLLLALISIIAVYSSSNALAFNEGKSTFSYLLEQSGFVIGGFLVLFVCYLIPLSWYRWGSFLLMAVAIGFMVFIIFKGMTINDANRWIKIFGISFQPSEITKIAVVLYLARIMEVKKFLTFKEYFVWILIPLGTICVLCLYGSVSATLIVGITAFVILVCGGIKWRYIWYTAGIVVVAVTIIFTIHKVVGGFDRLDTFTARVERFFTSEDESTMTAAELAVLKDKNYQSDEARKAIQLGGLTGRGPGNSLTKNSLPLLYSDFIFTLIVEEMGLLGGIFVIMMYMWFFSRCITIASHCTRKYSTLAVLGLGFLITLQAFIHILVNVGIFPVTGQTLPLISHGGTSRLIMSCAFGIILSINKTIEIKIEQTKNE